MRDGDDVELALALAAAALAALVPFVRPTWSLPHLMISIGAPGERDPRARSVDPRAPGLSSRWAVQSEREEHVSTR